VIRRRHPDFEWHETNVEMTVGDESMLRLRTRVELGGYDVFMVHGHKPGMPGKDECLAISRVGCGLEVATNTTALLLDAPGHAGGPLRSDRDYVQMPGSDERWWSEHVSALRRPENS
jgi:hypothetical protein